MLLTEVDPAMVNAIRERYQRLLDEVQVHSQKAGRAPGAVRLVVVSKSQGLEVVRAAVAAGVRCLGENYADEALTKIVAIRREYEVEWHMIGHVQSRKAVLVAENFSMLHSLDSLRLALRLENLLVQRDRILPTLLEFNVGGEESKSGWRADDETGWPGLLPDLERVLQLSHLKVCGLMTMPPYAADGELSRPYFRRLRRLQDFLSMRLPSGEWNELSIGTSADFRVAIEEGATFIRVGQAVLGPRPASKGIG